MATDFFDKNYDNLLKISKNICSKNNKGDDPYELLQYSIEQLLTNSKCDEIIESGFATFWLVRTMTNSIYSNTSHYSRNIRLQTQELQTDIEDTSVDLTEREMILDGIDDILNSISSKSIEGWYSVELFRLWVECRNYNRISKETGINRKSITTAVQTCKLLVIQELKNKKLYDL